LGWLRWGWEEGGREERRFGQLRSELRWELSGHLRGSLQSQLRGGHLRLEVGQSERHGGRILVGFLALLNGGLALDGAEVLGDGVVPGEEMGRN
jgi:hypothetical protein